MSSITEICSSILIDRLCKKGLHKRKVAPFVSSLQKSFFWFITYRYSIKPRAPICCQVWRGWWLTQFQLQIKSNARMTELNGTVTTKSDCDLNCKGNAN